MNRRDFLNALGALAGSLAVPAPGITMAAVPGPGAELLSTSIEWHYALFDYNLRLGVAARVAGSSGMYQCALTEVLPAGAYVKSVQEAIDRFPEVHQRLKAALEQWVEEKVQL